MEDVCIFLLDELMALLEAAWQEANVLEALSIEHFDDEFENFVVKVSDVQIVICLTHLLIGKGTLAEIRLSDEIVGLLVVPRNLLRVQTEQADVHLILAIVEALPHLVQQISFVATIRYLELRTPRQHSLPLEHRGSAINDYQS